MGFIQSFAVETARVSRLHVPRTLATFDLLLFGGAADAGWSHLIGRVYDALNHVQQVTGASN